MIRGFNKKKVIADKLTAGTYTAIVNVSQGRDLLIHHHIALGAGEETVTGGGHVSVECSVDAVGAVLVPHHGDDENLKTGAATASYSTLVRGCSEFMKLTLTLVETNDAIHNVYIESIG